MKIQNIISHFDEPWPRLIKFHKAHFSIDEFERQLILVQSALNDKSENHLWESSLNELVERKDKLDLFADSNSFLSDCLKSFYKEKSDIQMQTYRELNERYTSALVKSIEESETMSLLSVGIRISLRQLNMIPNTDSYGWWYSVNSLTEEDVNMSFQAKIDNDRVFELKNCGTR